MNSNELDAKVDWDCGRVECGQSACIAYEGPPIPSTEDAYWRVRVWGVDGRRSEWSKVARWTAGIWPHDRWAANWICCSESLKPDPGRPVQLFRREFEVPESKMWRARLAFTARGWVRVAIDGTPVEDHRLGPDWTDYRFRIPYRVVDVLERLTPGRHVLSAEVADGWLAGQLCWFGRHQYGLFPALLARLAIEFDDLQPMLVVSDTDWKCSTGEIRSADLMDGEFWDMSHAQPVGWRLPGFDDSKWRQATALPLGQAALVASSSEPVEVIEEIAPVRIELRPNGTRLVDFGVNQVGVVRLKIPPNQRKALRIRHAEVLDADGNLYSENLRSAKATDEIVPTGQAEFEPRFTFHGFRHAEIEGLQGELAPGDISFQILGSGFTEAMDFWCDEPRLVQLWGNIRRSFRGNFLSIPTDCPQRDERLGWTGDIQVFAPTACLLGHIGPFLRHWMQSVCDGVNEDGIFPNIAPNLKQLGDGAPGWADAGVLVPWCSYRHFGDTEILRRSFPFIWRHLDALWNANPDGIWRNRRSHDFGDWLSVGEETDRELIGSAFLAHSTQVGSQIAAVLGAEFEAKRLAKLADDARRAFSRAYWRFERLSCDTQTAYVLALAFGLLEKEAKPGAAARLAEKIRENGTKLSTGFLGVSEMLPVLRDNGFADLANELLLADHMPSWLYPVKHGATSIWERWDGWTEESGFQDPGMNSFNHYAYGSVGRYMVESIGGLRLDETAVAFKEFAVKPQPPTAVRESRMRFESPYGLIVIAWNRLADSRKCSVSIPPNTRAAVDLTGLGAARWTLDGREIACGDSFGSGELEFLCG